MHGKREQKNDECEDKVLKEMKVARDDDLCDGDGGLSDVLQHFQKASNAQLVAFCKVRRYDTNGTPAEIPKNKGSMADAKDPTKMSTTKNLIFAAHAWRERAIKLPPLRNKNKENSESEAPQPTILRMAIPRKLQQQVPLILPLSPPHGWVLQ
jgi:hypothetical protein